MSKLLGTTVVLVLAALGVAIASLVFNILIFNQINTSDDVVVDPSATTSSPSDGGCPTVADISTDDHWKEASNRLLETIDFAADPCEDFYQFTCGKYLQDTDLEGLSRKGTYDEAQYNINLDLANYFDGFTNVNKLTSKTEQYEYNFYKKCYADGKLDPSDPAVRKQKWTDLSKDLNTDLGFPLVGVKRIDEIGVDDQGNDDSDAIFHVMGNMERLFTGGPLMTSFVTADFANNVTNALYINQPALHFARDYFVKPQFIDKLQQYAIDIRNLIVAYYKNMGLTIDHKYCPNDQVLSDEDCAMQVAQWAVNIERSIAMSSWPEDELRNYKQQYTAFDDLDVLDAYFQSLALGKYVRGLLKMGPNDNLPKDADNNALYKVVISQPTYLAALDGQFEAKHISVDDYVNYLAIHWLMDNANEYGIDIPDAYAPANARKTRNSENAKREAKKFDKYITRKGWGARRISRKPLNAKGLANNPEDELRTGCIDALIDYMPFGPGYTYVKNRDDRDLVRADVETMTMNIIDQFGGMLNSLDWIDPESLSHAFAKSDQLIKNYLWPDSVFGTDWKSSEKVDDYHNAYSVMKDSTMTYWEVIKNMKAALMSTEQWDIVDAGTRQTPEELRSNFLQSPATVNAWYQPERNSITFPFGILNPPYYDRLYPQAYNYAGQGGTAGHELTHGYDDEGTQFDEYGVLADCQFTHCSILDDDSRSGFVDMAQCVVQQYNSQCCPLKKGNVRCANGDTTQGENIADIGGQQAAYRAYNKYIADMRITEKRLPGLEQYTPKQIFWMTYGVSWCMKITDDRLVRQLMTDPHAPSSCRVNQVMQDIPEFGIDFKCKQGKSPMFPPPDDRCMVWVGSGN